MAGRGGRTTDLSSQPPPGSPAATPARAPKDGSATAAAAAAAALAATAAAAAEAVGAPGTPGTPTTPTTPSFARLSTASTESFSTPNTTTMTARMADVLILSPVASEALSDVAAAAAAAAAGEMVPSDWILLDNPGGRPRSITQPHPQDLARHHTHTNLVSLVARRKSRENAAALTAPPDTGPPSAAESDPGQAAAAEDVAKQPLRKRRDILRHSWPPTMTDLFDFTNASTDELAETNHDLQIASREIRLTDLEWGPVIGEGFYGRVYRARHRRTDKTLVLKELKRDHEHREAFIEEMSILKTLKHDNVLEYVGIFCKDRKLFLVTEFISGGTLSEVIAKTDVELPWDRRLQMARDLASGLDYLHSKRIIHRDLKSENCMVRGSGAVVIVDFGLAKTLEGEEFVVPTKITTLAKRRSACILPLEQRRSRNTDERPMSIVGSPYWMAPEMMGGTYGLAADVFSFGIVLCELIGRVSADPDIMPRTNNFGVDEAKFRVDFARDCPEKFLSLAFQCCIVKPLKKRPTINNVESHLRALCIQREAAQAPPRTPKQPRSASGLNVLTPVRETRKAPMTTLL